MKNKHICRLYVGLVLVFLLLPFVCMGFAKTTTTTENKELAELPGLMEDGSFNLSFLSDLGAYFEDHFAFRQEMVSANSKLMSGIFHTSPMERVIVGENGWLYYSGTLDDYQGTGQLSDRSLYNIAHNLTLMQGMAEALGTKFYYTVAPNKNTLYDENMPYYYKKGTTSNLERLIPFLEEEQVNYIDLKTAFLNQDEVLYLKRDSHWNNKGAVLAYNTILNTFGKEHETYTDVPYELSDDYIGDLNEMLYPLNAEPEPNQIYQKEAEYSFVTEDEDVEADWIETVNPDASGSVLVYRDSFGNTLFPLIANEFEHTYFTRLVPYSLSDISTYRPDYVLVERVERRIASVIESPPIMQGPSYSLRSEREVETETTVSTRMSGSYLVIEGQIDPDYLETRSRIFVSVYPSGSPNGVAYEAFGTLTEVEDNEDMEADTDAAADSEEPEAESAQNSSENIDCGYQLYLMEQNVPQGTAYDIEIITVDENGSQTVCRQTITN